MLKVEIMCSCFLSEQHYSGRQTFVRVFMSKGAAWVYPANHSAEAWVELDHLQPEDWSVYAADGDFANSLM